MQRNALLAATLAATLLAGCASVENPASRVPERVAALPASTDARVPLGVPAREWWRALGDPQLDALVTDAAGRNHDVQAALASVVAARSEADAAHRDALPRGGLDVQAQVQRPSTAEADPYRLGTSRPPSSRLVTLGQGLAWEIDLFGRVGTAAAVADRRADVASADLHAATALLQGEVVRHYAGLRLQQQAAALLAEEADLQAAHARQLHVRVAAGLADRREALAADAEHRQVQADTGRAEAALHAHLAALAVLAGRSPAERDAWHEALLATGMLPALPADETLVQPTDLLARRPDVARADAELRAALGEAVLAERAHLPRLSVNMVLGLNAPFGQLGDAGALRHAAGPALTWDWLDFGRIKARAEAARAGEAAALHAFEQTVLKALQDSETALREWASARSALVAARQAEGLVGQSATYTRTRAEAGLVPPSAALQESVAHLRARRGAAAAQAHALLAYARTQLALGAWQPSAPMAALR